MFTFSTLVNAWSLESVIQSLCDIIIVFCSKTVNKSVEEAFQRLSDKFSHLGETDVEFVTKAVDQLQDEADDINDDLPESEEKLICSSSQKPFLPYLMERTKDVTACDSKSFPTNLMFQPQFIETLKMKRLSMVPFWTNILRGGVL